ncbi:transcriptional regulator, partial [Pseudomonas aeruginosa]
GAALPPNRRVPQEPRVTMNIEQIVVFAQANSAPELYSPAPEKNLKGCLLKKYPSPRVVRRVVGWGGGVG